MESCLGLLVAFGTPSKLPQNSCFRGTWVLECDCAGRGTMLFSAPQRLSRPLRGITSTQKFPHTLRTEAGCIWWYGVESLPEGHYTEPLRRLLGWVVRWEEQLVSRMEVAPNQQEDSQAQLSQEITDHVSTSCQIQLLSSRASSHRS